MPTAVDPQSDRRIAQFKRVLGEFYRENRRDFPWRRTFDPYRILVSEIMLQQTQTERVVPKYRAFLREFPTIRKLAEASPARVLVLWQGLGYNRRALFLHRAAQAVVAEHGGKVPLDPVLLRTLPGIGAYTAAAVCAFAGGLPTAFIETNIRTVFIKHFFTETEVVDDREILKLVAATVDSGDPREWYYALMDYGAWLKRNEPGLGKRSKHYVKQSKFQGSVRQVRGAIIRALSGKALTEKALRAKLGPVDERFDPALSALLKEGLIKKRKSTFSL